MANITITVPDALVPRLKAAMNWRFPETVGQPDAASFKAKTAEYWKAILVEYEVFAAQQARALELGTVGTAAQQKAETDGSAIG